MAAHPQVHAAVECVLQAEWSATTTTTVQVEVLATGVSGCWPAAVQVINPDNPYLQIPLGGSHRSVKRTDSLMPGV